MAYVYFDFGAANNGNGTTPAQASSGGGVGAYNTLVGATVNSGDVWLVRRSATALSLAAAFTTSLAGLTILGWPISGDDYYSSRPAAGTSAGWDADAATFAKILSTSATYNFAPTGTINLQRVWVSSTNTSTQTLPLGNFAGNNMVVKWCKFAYDSAVNGTSVQLPALTFTGQTPRCENTVATGSSTGAANTPIVTVTQAAANDGYFKNLTINCTALPLGAGSNASSAALQYTGIVGYKPILFEGTTINVLGSQTYSIGTALLTLTQGPILRDLTITGPSGSSYQGASVYMNAPRTEVFNATFTGNAGPVVFASNYCTFECKSYTNTYQMSMGVTATTPGTYSTAGSYPPITFAANAGGNQLFLTNANLKGSNQQIWNGGNLNEMMFNWVTYSGTNATSQNMTGQTQVATTLGYDFDWYEQNALQVLGSFRYTNRHGQWLTTNTYRSGSAANFALKCSMTEPDYGQNRRGMLIGNKGREQAFLNLLNGTSVIRVYGAYKSWAGTNEAAPTTRDIGINFDYYNGAGYVAISTFADGSLTGDSSTWVNDTGLTAFVLTVTLSDVSGAQAVPFNLSCSPEFDSSGYVYIDPAVTVGAS